MMKQLLLLAILLSHLAYGQKTKSQTKVADELVVKLNEVNLPNKPIRLAMAPFVSSVKSEDAKNTFGEYLTESILGKLSENPAQFKLFERSRLDAIFKENELMLSGMMNPSEALKIGQLLPIDALFSGTYTKLKSYVDISGRLIDVTTGEILTAYAGRIKLTKNVKTLFPINSEELSSQGPAENATSNPATITVIAATAEYEPSEEEMCRARVEEFKTMLEDLSTPEKVNHIASEAMKTPFDNLCGKLHYEVMYNFNRYKIKHEGYRSFLLNTLNEIALPSKDERSYEIIRFITKDDELSEKEWQVVLGSITKLEYGQYRYLSLAISDNDIRTAQSRIDQYFELVNAQKMGLPTPTEYDKAFYQMMQGLSRKHELMLYTYERYSDKLGSEKSYTVSNHMLYLNRMYEGERNPEIKSKVLQWIANYFHNHKYEKSADQLYDFAYKYKLRENKNGNKAIDLENEEISAKYPEKDLLRLIQMCKDEFTTYAIDTKYNSQLEDRIDFCVKYGIPVPGMIPSMQEASQILKGNDLKEQERVMKLLIQMGDQPRSLEKDLIALFDKRSLDNKNDLISVQAYAIEILGNIKTSDTRAINYMISKLMSYNYKESDKSEEALTKIGKPAINPMLTKLKSTTIQDGGLRYKLIVLLGKNGRDAKVAEPTLLKIQKENGNKDIAYAIEAALQSLNK
ncbi:MAG: FlgO family outer membrane protein [Cyclobacteriaceae bacterium]